MHTARLQDGPDHPGAHASQEGPAHRGAHSSQPAPVQRSVQRQVSGAVQLPPFSQGSEQTGTAQAVPLQPSAQVSQLGPAQLPAQMQRPGPEQVPPFRHPPGQTGSSQVGPVQSLVQEQISGAVQRPPFRQRSEQTGASQRGPLQSSVQLQVSGARQVPPFWQPPVQTGKAQVAPLQSSVQAQVSGAVQVPPFWQAGVQVGVSQVGPVQGPTQVTQVPSTQEPERQSRAPSAQASPFSQTPQRRPPQSVSVSSPFFTPSEQVAVQTSATQRAPPLQSASTVQKSGSARTWKRPPSGPSASQPPRATSGSSHRPRVDMGGLWRARRRKPGGDASGGTIRQACRSEGPPATGMCASSIRQGGYGTDSWEPRRGRLRPDFADPERSTTTSTVQGLPRPPPQSSHGGSFGLIPETQVERRASQGDRLSRAGGTAQGGRRRRSRRSAGDTGSSRMSHSVRPLQPSATSKATTLRASGLNSTPTGVTVTPGAPGLARGCCRGGACHIRRRGPRRAGSSSHAARG